MVLVDAAMLTLLNGAMMPAPAARPALAGFHQGVIPAPNNGVELARGIHADAQARFAALLMSPVPVLATIMRQQLEQTATMAVDGASSLIDFAQSSPQVPAFEGGPLTDASDAYFDNDVMMGGESGEGVGGGSGVEMTGATAMVGAAAAALALMNIRQQQHN